MINRLKPRTQQKYRAWQVKDILQRHIQGCRLEVCAMRYKLVIGEDWRTAEYIDVEDLRMTRREWEIAAFDLAREKEPQVTVGEPVSISYKLDT